MSCLTFLSDNLIDNATLSILTGTENAQFPLSNLKSTFTTKEFRSTGNTVEILVDLLTTQSVDSFAVAGHSVDGLGFTDITIYGSATLDFSGSTPIVINTNAEYAFGFNLFTSGAFRYWKIALTGTGSFASLSNIFLGAKTAFTENSLSIKTFNYTNKDNSRVRKNKYNQKFVDKTNRTRLIKGGIKFMNTAEFDLVNGLYNNHGISDPIWMIVDPDGTSATDGEFMFSMYGYFRRVSTITMSGFGIYNANIDMEQAG